MRCIPSTPLRCVLGYHDTPSGLRSLDSGLDDAWIEVWRPRPKALGGLLRAYPALRPPRASCVLGYHDTPSGLRSFDPGLDEAWLEVWRSRPRRSGGLLRCIPSTPLRCVLGCHDTPYGLRYGTCPGHSGD